MNYSRTLDEPGYVQVNQATILYVGILAFFVSEYFNPYAFAPFLLKLRISSILPLSVFFLWLLVHQGKKVKAVQSKYLMGILFVMGFSVTYALLTRNVVDRSKQFLGYLLIYFVTINVIRSKNRLRGLFLTITFIHLAIILTNPEFITAAGRTRGIRAGYFLGDGNDFSLSLNIIIPITIFLLATETRKFLKILLLGSLITFVSIVVVAESRASTIALTAMGIYMCLRSDQKKMWIIILAVASLGIVTFSSTSYINRIESIASYEEDSSAQMRLVAWRAGWKMAVDYPITGVGAGNFNSIYGRFYREDNINWFAGSRWISPHSLYVQSLAETGFVGFGLLAALFAANYKAVASIRGGKRKDTPKEKKMLSLTLETMLIGFFLNAAFLNVLYYPHIAVISAIIVASKEIYVREENE